MRTCSLDVTTQIGLVHKQLITPATKAIAWVSHFGVGGGCGCVGGSVRWHMGAALSLLGPLASRSWSQMVTTRTRAHRNARRLLLAPAFCLPSAPDPPSAFRKVPSVAFRNSPAFGSRFASARPRRQGGAVPQLGFLPEMN